MTEDWKCNSQGLENVSTNKRLLNHFYAQNTSVNPGNTEIETTLHDPKSPVSEREVMHQKWFPRTEVTKAEHESMWFE